MIKHQWIIIKTNIKGVEWLWRLCADAVAGTPRFDWYNTSDITHSFLYSYLGFPSLSLFLLLHWHFHLTEPNTRIIISHRFSPEFTHDPPCAKKRQILPWRKQTWRTDQQVHSKAELNKQRRKCGVHTCPLLCCRASVKENGGKGGVSGLEKQLCGR